MAYNDAQLNSLIDAGEQIRSQAWSAAKSQLPALLANYDVRLLASRIAAQMSLIHDEVGHDGQRSDHHLASDLIEMETHLGDLVATGYPGIALHWIGPMPHVPATITEETQREVSERLLADLEALTRRATAIGEDLEAKLAIEGLPAAARASYLVPTEVGRPGFVLPTTYYNQLCGRLAVCMCEIPEGENRGPFGDPVDLIDVEWGTSQGKSKLMGYALETFPIALTAIKSFAHFYNEHSVGAETWQDIQARFGRGTPGASLA